MAFRIRTKSILVLTFATLALLTVGVRTLAAQEILGRVPDTRKLDRWADNRVETAIFRSASVHANV